MSHHYCVVLGETGKGKSSFLNAALKNHGVDQTLDANDLGEGCTKSIKPCSPIDIGDDKYIFIDTPGLNDEDLDEKTKEALRHQATNPDNRISAILICLHIDDKRLSKSIREMLREFMNSFPLNDFWKHVLIIRTHVREMKLKKPGNLEESVIKNLGNYMSQKNIAYPSNLKDREFFFNSVIDDDDGKLPYINTDKNIKNEFKKVFAKINELDPFFKQINLKSKFSREEGNFNVTYEEYEYVDFNGNKQTKLVEKAREFKVKQVGKIGAFTGKRYKGTKKDCWGNDYTVYQDYKYYIDEKGNECDEYDVGEPYEV